MKKRVIIVGATSGIGLELTQLFVKEGSIVGIAGRREEKLNQIKQTAPDQIVTEVIDVTTENATEGLDRLITKLGRVDIYFHSSGIGFQNFRLKPEVELSTIRTNVEGFGRMATHMFNFFSKQGDGHLAVISSIAGTKGLGVAPAYSATKRFQSTYIDALEQLAYLKKINITFSDIRPGFIATPLLDDGGSYPMLMNPQKVAHEIYQKLLKRRRVITVDWRYRLLVFFWRLIPRWLWKRLPIKMK